MLQDEPGPRAVELVLLLVREGPVLGAQLEVAGEHRIVDVHGPALVNLLLQAHDQVHVAHHPRGPRVVQVERDDGVVRRRQQHLVKKVGRPNRLRQPNARSVERLDVECGRWVHPSPLVFGHCDDLTSIHVVHADVRHKNLLVALDQPDLAARLGVGRVVALVGRQARAGGVHLRTAVGITKLATGRLLDDVHLLGVHVDQAVLGHHARDDDRPCVREVQLAGVRVGPHVPDRQRVELHFAAAVVRNVVDVHLNVPGTHREVVTGRLLDLDVPVADVVDVGEDVAPHGSHLDVGVLTRQGPELRPAGGEDRDLLQDDRHRPVDDERSHALLAQLPDLLLGPLVPEEEVVGASRLLCPRTTLGVEVQEHLVDALRPLVACQGRHAATDH